MTSTPTTMSKAFMTALLVAAEIVPGVTMHTVLNCGLGSWTWTSRMAATRVRAPGRYESEVRSVANA